MEQLSPMYAPERHQAILDLARERGRVEVRELAEQLAVTPETIRRDLTSLERLAANPPARARVIPLQVAGAFHTPFMQSALDAFAPVAAAQHAHDPLLSLLSNADGRAYSGGPDGMGSGVDVLHRLAQQIVAPVRWDLCQETFAALGITGMLELAPGGVLAGLARRSLPGVETVAVKSPSDIDAARDLIARHGTPRSQESTL